MMQSVDSDQATQSHDIVPPLTQRACPYCGSLLWSKVKRTFWQKL